MNKNRIVKIVGWGLTILGGLCSLLGDFVTASSSEKEQEELIREEVLKQMEGVPKLVDASVKREIYKRIGGSNYLR